MALGSFSGLLVGGPQHEKKKKNDGDVLRKPDAFIYRYIPE